MVLQLPSELCRDMAAREICSLWVYLMELDNVHNMTIAVILFHKGRYVCLKKSRHRHCMVSLVLRHIFWWSLAHNVKLVFTYNPFFC